MPSTFAVTISRQLGSGGSYIGREVARRLGYAYIDREILQLAAKELGVDEAALVDRRERLQTFWEKLATVFAVGAPDSVYTPPPYWVSDAQLIEIERRLILELAGRGPCVILGHGAFHLLRGQERLFNVFVHAPVAFRAERVMSVYHARNNDEALRMIENSDRERARFIENFTGRNWFDARSFHLTIDTSVVDFALAEEMIASMAVRLPEEGTWPWVNEPV